MWKLPVLLTVLATHYCVTVAQDESAESAKADTTTGVSIEISPKGTGPTPTLFVHAGSNVALNCKVISQRSESKVVVGIEWEKEEGVKISHSQKDRPYALSFPKKRKSELILYIPAITKSDEGVYTCVAKLEDDQEVKKTIHVEVIQEVSWLCPNHYETFEGSPFSIECSASGDPTPEVSILPFGGNGFDPTVTIDKENEAKITVETAKPGVTATKFICQAVQTHPQASFVTLKTIEVDLKYKPKFKTSTVVAYGIEERNATLVCQVDSANPQDVKFKFYRKVDDELTEIEGSDDKYDISSNTTAMRSELMIKQLKEVDFLAEFSCAASNMVGTGDLYFTITKISPPAQMQASFSHSNEHVVTFTFTDPDYTGHEMVPITDYKIEYWKFKSEDDPPPTNPKFIVVKKETDTSYSVTGLDLDSDYRFRIAAGNPAGYGQPTQLNARTKQRGYSASMAKQQQAKANDGCKSIPLSATLLLLAAFCCRW